MYQASLSDCDIARILAGLRLLQGGADSDVKDILTNCGRHDLPYAKEIDALCERLNLSHSAQPISAPSADYGKTLAYVCPECGSHDVCSDAAARWNVAKQEWELAGVHDNCACQACGYDADFGFEVQS
jgi:hypothetical protein